MTQSRIRATFMRGGTSKGVLFRQADLPADRNEWDAIFLRVMGSPDPNQRQLDGMGGGISSLSKICVVGPSTHAEADVDYTFAQICVDEELVDYSANCGNMSSAIGPFAVDEGMVKAPADGEALVRIHNTNTGKVIHSRFAIEGGFAAVDGDLAIDGVGGTAAPIKLEFTDPGGAGTGRLLPTGNAVDLLKVDGRSIEASLVDAANPCVFVRAADLGKVGDEMPEALESDGAFLDSMERIRRTAAVAMGLTTDLDNAATIPGIPKVAILFSPIEMTTLNGRKLSKNDYEIGIRMISVGRPHRAIPVTGALCLAVASRLEGTIASRLAGPSERQVRIGHPSGVIAVDASVVMRDGRPHAEYGTLFRTARRLFEGNVLYRSVVRTSGNER